jgi:Tfp pilus assembly protein PilF
MPVRESAGNEGFRIKYPFLLLAVAVLIVYFPAFSFDLTELDDSIFIRDFASFNEDFPKNLKDSFTRGLFDPTKDPYYRPLFLVSMILNYWLSGHGESLASYHVVNVLLHLGSVLLLFKLFSKLNLKDITAFILCLVFAVHPVLSQAVAWIPGRNDTLLAIFILSFLLHTINYSNEGKPVSLVWSTLFLLLAFFTKETAVFAAPVAFVLLVFVLQKKWLDKRNLTQYGIWIGCFIIWFAVRASATIQTNISPAQIVHDFVPRLPLIIQYLGKVLLPFNLSVFPTQADTVYYYGIAAAIIFAAIIFLNKQRNLKIVLSGLAIFLLFLLPVLFVPSNLNEQSFEHRLYLPMIGILLLLSQTVLLNNKLADKQLFIGGIAITGVLAVMNFMHQKNFENKITFWTSAVETSPNSAYANMMLAARLDDEKKSYQLFRKAYRLDPNQKYLNFYYGVMLQKQDSVAQSEKYLLKEKNTSGYYECDFYLARVAIEKKDFEAAINYLKTYLKTDPTNNIANNNLLLLYLDTKQPDKAREHAKNMMQNHVDVPQQLRQQLGI